VPVTKLSSIALLVTLSAVVASCGSNGSLTAPSHVARAGGAVIIGRVLGMSTTTQRHLSGDSSIGTIDDLTFTQNASTTLTVTISGTNISSNVDGNGNFELTGVPPGDVTLKFSGAGVNASITLNGVPASAQISITVTLNGNSARLESEERDDDGEDDDEDKDENEVKGTISNRSGNCPMISFSVQGTTVTTNGNTKFEDGSCAQVVNGARVEVEGTRQSNNTILAKEVEID
jgi:Domain of unknown function (DUF5666)